MHTGNALNSATCRTPVSRGGHASGRTQITPVLRASSGPYRRGFSVQNGGYACGFVMGSGYAP